MNSPASLVDIVLAGPLRCSLYKTGVGLLWGWGDGGDTLNGKEEDYGDYGESPTSPELI